MNYFNLIIIITAIGLISLIYQNKFLLSLLISLELILLNLMAFNLYASLITSNSNYTIFSLYIIALSAVEASIGISLISLISRNFNNTSILNLNILKN
uniref:NADH dehydrogenase subunit 4L n=1 Tax=Ophioleila elegans TaxID=1815333 RepID=UPI0023F208F8|nr:NADH dehydrogenase subunit 4L [Ophioleila elegans]WED07064.1 NADH dehydrogenase subunit 4L [Ophioleila elegans]